MYIKKEVLIGIIAGAVALALLTIGICIGAGDSGDSGEPQTVQLTKENFDEYFTYEVTSNTYYALNGLFASYGYGDITLTFRPLKNIEIEDGALTVKIDSISGADDISGCAIWIDGEETLKIPYNGNFTIRFADGATSMVSWQNLTSSAAPHFAGLTEVTIEEVSGTIILK